LLDVNALITAIWVNHPDHKKADTSSASISGGSRQPADLLFPSLAARFTGVVWRWNFKNRTIDSHILTNFLNHRLLPLQA
jgi:hypothetical protein